MADFDFQFQLKTASVKSIFFTVRHQPNYECGRLSYTALKVVELFITLGA